VLKSRDRPTGDVKATRTLFVINFDPIHTKIRDIEKHFEPYDKISNPTTGPDALFMIAMIGEARVMTNTR
jgi:hypothetical protein